MKKKSTLSVVLAVRNEEANIARCLEAVEGLADEIIAVDEYSTDNTREIAKRYGAKVFSEPHHENFHITKQKAIDKAKSEWILQLDADEVVTPDLAREIKAILSMTDEEIAKRKPFPKQALFNRHQKALEVRDGNIGKKTGEIVAFFIPRRNMFLGKPLIHAGVYPDAVIRLIKRGKAYLPAKSVHEQMKVEGQVGWLMNDLEHYDSPTLKRYLTRLNRYTDIRALEFEHAKVHKDVITLFKFITFTPLVYFLRLFIRHRGYLDGVRGFLWSFFSALHYPIAYFKYWTLRYNDSNGY